MIASNLLPITQPSIQTRRIIGLFALAFLALAITPSGSHPHSSALAQNPSIESSSPSNDEKNSTVAFESKIKPFLQTYCNECHNESQRESGIRLDNLDPSIPDSTIPLWNALRKQVADKQMPPEDSPQPTDSQREFFLTWADQALHIAKTRPQPKNGAMRRLTVNQYSQTLKQLLNIDSNLTDILPPDGISRDGFTNQADVLQMTPLQLDTFFDIAKKALQSAIVNTNEPPRIEAFRMDFGKGIHPNPSNESLILGANNHLLPNGDFIVHELDISKPFPFEPWQMQKSFRFIEGYQGNDTVRGWKDFSGIHHSVFACMRGTEGYPQGKAYELFPNGLALRPAIPSPEIFGESSTYGPHANFKISLRELPDRGPFQVRVKASKAHDALLCGHLFSYSPLDSFPAISLDPIPDQPKASNSSGTIQTTVEQPGIYAVEVYPTVPQKLANSPSFENLEQELLGYWPMENANDDGLFPKSTSLSEKLLTGSANLQPSPFGKSLNLENGDGAFALPHYDALNVGTSDFTISAWINPTRLTQSGIVCLGGYGYTQGWLLDMPDDRGTLRLETAKANQQHNGTIQSPPGTLRKDRWQHVCAVIRRAPESSELFVNGYRVATGTIESADLANPNASLHIGRIQNGQHFHGQIDEVRLYRRPLTPAEVLALVEPGSQFADPPSLDNTNKELTLHITPANLPEIAISGQLQTPCFAILRLPKGPIKITSLYNGKLPIEKILLRHLDPINTPNPNDPSTAQPPNIEQRINPDQTTKSSLYRNQLLEAFSRFEKRSPKLGVHIGLRRDCGSTMSQVAQPINVTEESPTEFIFDGYIENFPSPDVEPNNVNYLAGIREIGVRHEFTDGRDTPRLVIHSIEFEGPYFEQWPPKPHRQIFADRDLKESDEHYANRILSDFARRAFRRPLSQNESNTIFNFWKEQFATSKELQPSIEEALCFVLTSPQFLYISEASQSSDGEPLDDWELASKLSYFLWNAPPDQELIDLAQSGTLRANLDAQIDRLIASPNSFAFAETFVSQWLGLNKLETVEVDRKKFPHLTKEAKQALRLEPIHSFWRLLRENRPIRELISSDSIVVNEPVASYYGLSGLTESGFDFQPVEHQTPGLGGILSQAALMIGLSDGREANPVKRGAWFARKIIDSPPEDPPPNVPKLEDLTELSLREKLERHRNVQGCANCHAGIDPWGLPFEAFDASGRFDPQSRDASSTLPNGTQVQDFIAFRSYLLNEQLDQVAQSVTKHLATYACGRRLSYNETGFIRENIKQLHDSDYRLKDLIRWIIHSKLFDEK
jgi:hypothetical protein